MNDITVQSVITIRQAMKALDKTAEKCLVVVDENNKLLGTLTNGDLRRSILDGIKFSEDISGSYNTEPTVLVKDKYSKEEAKNLLRDLKLDLIPIIDNNNLVLDYITWRLLGGKNQFKKSLNNIPVVIMAGGKGTRLEPFTKVLPKPLVPIDEKPIIEHIIEHFTELGCFEFHLTVNYKAKILKAYFEELKPDYNVYFVEEQEPLGTAGSLSNLHGRFEKPFFVTNCDIIINADYVSLYKFHRKGDYDITLVASAKEYVIPYGTCELNDEGHLSHINEKPRFNIFINTGLYVLNPDMLGLIPENKFYHITQLIEDAKNRGKKVGVYPIDDDAWIDVGQWVEYKKVVDKL
jgi:dTDP-glucose pyrophosphorylase